jgi:hypothetical protein
MSGVTATSKCRYCKAQRRAHIIQDDHTKPKCPDDSGRRFAHYRAHKRRSMSFNPEEIRVIRTYLEREPRYGVGYNQVVQDLRRKFEQMGKAIAAEEKERS